MTPSLREELSDSEPKRLLRDVERRLAEHPAHKAYLECLAIERAISDVFLPNWHELLALLDQAATNERLAVELIQNVHAPAVREQFQALVTQRLHNYLASTTSVVDHVRRVMRGRSGELADEYARRKDALLEHPEVRFMVDLRNFTLHRAVPFLGHTLSITAVNTPDQRMESEVELSVGELLAWEHWSGASRAFLEQQGDALILRAIVRRHGELVASLNVWLHNELVSENATGIDELNKLVVERNAVLMGGDIDTAKRLTDEWTARRDATRR